MADAPENGPDGQRWDPERYRSQGGFVAELGRPLLALLAPRAGERVLDLGCGEGRLTAEIAATGAQVIGIDASAEQVAAARDLGLEAHLGDGAALPFPDAAFDAAFSNAALHWMRDIDAVLAEVARVVVPGGRFVAEMGGAGNVANIVGVLATALARRGIDLRATEFPWIFPTPGDFRALLQRAGFEVCDMEHFARPTELPADIAGWLHTFAESFLNAVPERERDAFIAEVADSLALALRRPDGRWVADYVRLRVTARLRG